MRIAMRLLAAFVAVSALIATAPAVAEVVHFTAKLDGASETPPNDSKGVGEAQITLDTTAHKISWKVTYSGLTGPATMAHIHGPAAIGVAAPVVIPLPPPLGSPIKGSADITDGQIGDLRANLWYVNIHTAAHPAGEIRGQLGPGK
jgi:hypothetical protein